jgi:hypothetical protein
VEITAVLIGRKKAMMQDHLIKQEEEVKLAIKKILSDKKSYPTSLNWAINYCQVALSYYGEDLRVQCLYILNNISKWRHPDAKAVRATLKKFAGVK